MRYLSIAAAISCVVLAAARPRYGGTLRAETSANETLFAYAGPFRLATLRPGEFLRLEADENDPAGRPFLDAAGIQLGKARRDQLLDFEAGKADVVEAEVTDIRSLKQRAIGVYASKPMETIALLFPDPKLPGDVSQAMALSIDRLSIQRVLLDKQGEVSGALLPQWLSGYAFLFPSTQDVARARVLAHAAAPVAFCVDQKDKLLRPVADRITVDAAQVGLTLKPSSGACSVRLIRLPIRSADPRAAILAAAASLNLPSPSSETPYEMERELLHTARLVPLFHLPLVFALSPNVRNWNPAWNLADVWLEDAP